MSEHEKDLMRTAKWAWIICIVLVIASLWLVHVSR